MGSDVSIPLPLARRMLAELVEGYRARGEVMAEEAALVGAQAYTLDGGTHRRLERLIARANREMVPGCAYMVTLDHAAPVVEWRRRWANHRLAALERADDGWNVWTPDGTLFAGGPETGAEGRRKADAALRRWARRQGWRDAE